MLLNWLNPVSLDELGLNHLPEGALGRALTPWVDGDAASLAHCQVALLGVDPTAANALRQALYPLSWAFPGLHLADLGNLRRPDPRFFQPLLQELLDGGIFPLLIGDDPGQLSALFGAFLHQRNLASLALVDEHTPFTVQPHTALEYYLNPILHPRRRHLFHLSILGVQGHFANPGALDWLDEQLFECVRLGKARAELAELEPLLRDADLVGFHLGALKRCEAPAQRRPSPSGFFSEEACQLCRYAAMSDKLRGFSLHGFAAADQPATEVAATAATAAQMVWYFLDGFAARKHDYPVTNEGLTEYVVDFKGKDGQITFWRSNRSGRWWIQAPVKTTKKYQRHRLIPCSYNDYLLACDEELPDRLLQAFKRF